MINEIRELLEQVTGTKLTEKHDFEQDCELRAWIFGVVGSDEDQTVELQIISTRIRSTILISHFIDDGANGAFTTWTMNTPTADQFVIAKEEI